MPILGYYNPDTKTFSAFSPSGAKATNAYSHEDNSNDYYFAGWQGALFENRWKINASINHTNLKLVQWASSLDPSPNVTKVSKNSPLVGTVFDITKEYSVFVVHSTSLFPSTDKNSFGTQMPPVVGSSYEGGLKLDVLNGRISGTVSAYRITQTGGGKQVGNVENRNTARWDTMTPAERLANFPNQTRDDLFKAGDVVAAGKQRSTGVEADLVVQATPSWQILLTYANNDVKSIASPLASDIGRSTAGHIRQQFAMLHKYTFTEGELKGLYVGLGYQRAGKALQDYLGANGTPRNNPATNFLEAFAGYRVKYMGYNTMIQFNAKNLTKQDDFVGWKATGSDTIIATDRYRVPVPIRFSLTVGVDL
jgi:outer membrane receptor for ferric coprogen and ferric-rhodotorulic acid